MYRGKLSLKLIADAARVDFWRRHEMPGRLRTLAGILTFRSVLWLIAAAALMRLGMLVQGDEESLWVTIAGAAAMVWGIVLMSFAIAFVVGNGRYFKPH
jgi:hypothetical protein